jgi:hypothetical protein
MALAIAVARLRWTAKRNQKPLVTTFQASALEHENRHPRTQMA